MIQVEINCLLWISGKISEACETKTKQFKIYEANLNGLKENDSNEKKDNWLFTVKKLPKRKKKMPT